MPLHLPSQAATYVDLISKFKLDLSAIRPFIQSTDAAASTPKTVRAKKPDFLGLFCPRPQLQLRIARYIVSRRRTAVKSVGVDVLGLFARGRGQNFSILNPY
jgi:hypothetical protein